MTLVLVRRLEHRIDASHERAASGAAWRVALAATVAAALLIALQATTSLAPTSASVDPELVTLLRGMALIKALAVALGCAGVWWRFGWAVSSPVALAYVAGLGIAAGSAVLIWHLAFVGLAAVAFHAGELAVLVAAWRDLRAPVR